MKKIITASLVAMMAVTAAHADIASTTYVTTRTGTVSFDSGAAKGKTNLTEAIKAVDAALGTTTGNAATKSELQTAQNTLQANIDKKVDQTVYDAHVTAQSGVDSDQNADIKALQDSIAAGGDTDDAIKAAAAAAAAAQQTANGAVSVNTQQGTAITNLQQDKVDKSTYNTFVQSQATKDSGQDSKITALEASLGENGDTAKAIAAAQSTADGAVTVNNQQGQAITNLQNDKLDKSTYNTFVQSQATKDSGQDSKIAALETNSATKAQIDALNGATATEGTAGGTYIVNVAQEKGLVKPSFANFDTVVNQDTGAATSKNAPTTGAVKTYVDAQIQTVSSESGGRFDDVEQSVADLDAATVKRTQVGIAESFGISDACKQKDVICSLTVKGTGTGAVAQWEVVAK